MSDEEERALREAVYGRYYPGRRGREDWYVDADICAETNEVWKPAYALLRQWCGAEANARFDELQALRTEVRRLGTLVESAISVLREAGQGTIAEALERDLGVPAETLRAAAKATGSQ
jgi:hypothetical protein